MIYGDLQLSQARIGSLRYIAYTSSTARAPNACLVNLHNARQSEGNITMYSLRRACNGSRRRYKTSRTYPKQ